jgi:[acyl-carrier-protein] S-malonyltransferase
MAISKRVLLFPGQGIQSVGMCDSFAKSAWGTNLLERIDSALGFSLSKLMSEGPEPKLSLTEYAQPAIMASSLVTSTQLHWQHMKEAYGTSEEQFSYALGHSLGEYTACVVSGALSIEDGVRLAHIRGQAMQNAVSGLSTRMAAVLATEASVRQALSEITFPGICEIAGINHDRQIVLSGTQESVDIVTDHLKQKYKAIVKNLNVSAPFHCRLMKPAAERVRQELLQIEVKKSVIPVLSNAMCKPISEPEEIRKSLEENVVKPALFLRGMECVLRNGCTLFKELGSKRVLSSLVAKIIEDRRISGVFVDEADK